LLTNIKSTSGAYVLIEVNSAGIVDINKATFSTPTISADVDTQWAVWIHNSAAKVFIDDLDVQSANVAVGVDNAGEFNLSVIYNYYMSCFSFGLLPNSKLRCSTRILWNESYQSQDGVTVRNVVCKNLGLGCIDAFDINSLQVTDASIEDVGETGIFFTAPGGNLVVDKISVSKTPSGVYHEVEGTTLAGEITIKNSNFTENTDDGIYIASPFVSVEIQKVTSQKNAVAGAYIQSTATTGDSTISISESSFNENTKNGLEIVPPFASLQIENVDAGGNGQSGVFVESGDKVAGSVSVKDSTFNSNGVHGFYIKSPFNSIAMESVSAGSNGESGLNVQNPEISATTPGATGFSLTNVTFAGNGKTVPQAGVNILVNLAADAVAASFNTFEACEPVDIFINSGPPDNTVTSGSFTADASSCSLNNDPCSTSTDITDFVDCQA
jgi:hypothetical protein